MTAHVIRADARRLPLDDNTVDLVVTSPPYFALRSYQDGGEHYTGQIGDEPTPDEFATSLLEVTAECMRVVKPTGSIFVNLGDKYATYAGNRSSGRTSLQGSTDRSRPAVPRKAGLDGGGQVRSKSLMGIPWRYALRCIDELGLLLRAEIIWSKPNGMPESVTDRVRRSHEQWFHFTLEPRYYQAVDDIREPHAPGTAARAAAGFKANARHDSGNSAGSMRTAELAEGYVTNPLGKLPGSVWTVPTEPLHVPDDLGVDHYAAFPTAWPKRIIRGWSPADGVVLDPFGGTGTTAMVATALGRTGVSVDMSADYCRIGRWRTTDRNQLAKVLGIEKAPEPDVDQLDLFEGLA